MTVQHFGTNNRLYRLLTGGPRIGWATIGLGIAASGIGYAALLFLPKRAIFSVVWVILVAGCAASFPAAARLTDHAVRSSSYQFLRLTGVSASEVVRGFNLIALYRLRFGLGCLIGLAPLFVLSAYLYAFQGATQHCFAYISRPNWAKIVHDSGFTRVYRLPETAQCVAPGDARLAGSERGSAGCVLCPAVETGLAGTGLLPKAVNLYPALAA